MLGTPRGNMITWLEEGLSQYPESLDSFACRIRKRPEFLQSTPNSIQTNLQIRHGHWKNASDSLGKYLANNLIGLAWVNSDLPDLHSIQDALDAGAIAQEMKLSKEEATSVKLAAIGHDFSKQGDPIFKMSSCEQFTDQDFVRAVYTHPLLSALYIYGLEFFNKMVMKDTLRVVVGHHVGRKQVTESYYLDGYPENVKPNRLANILHLADSIDARTHRQNRQPLRPIMTPRDRCRAAQLITRVDREKSKWQQFEPTVAHAAMRVFHNDPPYAQLQNGELSPEAINLLDSLGIGNPDVDAINSNILKRRWELTREPDFA